MKQFLVLASLFAVLSVSAQQRPEQPFKDGKAKVEVKDGRRQVKPDFKDKKRPSAEQQMKRYEKYDLSSVQKQKIKDLHQERDRDMKKGFDKQQKEFAKQKEQDRKQFDKKLEQIMGKKQFAQYKQDRELKMKDRGQMKKRGDFREFDKSKRG